MVIKCLERSRAGQEVKKRSADLQEKYSFFTQSSGSNKYVPTYTSVYVRCTKWSGRIIRNPKK